jgi:hypothetical protein
VDQTGVFSATNRVPDSEGGRRTVHVWSRGGGSAKASSGRLIRGCDGTFAKLRRDAIEVEPIADAEVIRKILAANPRPAEHAAAGRAAHAASHRRLLVMWRSAGIRI